MKYLLSCLMLTSTLCFSNEIIDGPKDIPIPEYPMGANGPEDPLEQWNNYDAE